MYRRTSMGLNVALIGAGNIAGAHLSALRRSESSRVAGIFDVDRRRAEEQAARCGVLLAQAVHPAYTLRWLLGDVASVSSTFGRRKIVEMASEDTAAVTLTFESGVIAQMVATFALRRGPHDHGIMLYGDEGYLEIG